MIGQTLGHYRIVEKLDEEQLNFRTDEKAEPALPLEQTEDPVRMYLREMGTVPLLTREGEVEIAKRIERGQNNVLKAMSRCPIVIREVQKLGEELKSGDLPAFFGPPITGEQRQSAWLSRSRVLLGQREPASPASAHRHPSQHGAAL